MVCLCFCLSVCLSICLSVSVCLCLSVLLSVKESLLVSLLVFFCLSCNDCVIIAIYRVVRKTAHSLWHHNFATVHHRVMWLLAKCSERNSLHDSSQCLNTAVKYSLFLLLTSELLKNRITFNVPWSIKTCHYYFFNSSVKHWQI